MDHDRALVLEALAAYHRLSFTPPGHKQGRGADTRVLTALGDAVFISDILATAGLDDRTASHHVLEEAQALMADAVGAHLLLHLRKLAVGEVGDAGSRLPA